MPDLCTLEDLKDWLGIPVANTDSDAKLSRLITATSADFISRIDRAGFTPSTAYEQTIEIKNWQSESRIQRVYLRNYPVNAVTGVVLNDIIDLPEWDASDPCRPGYSFDDSATPESRQFVSLRGVSWHTMPLRVTVSYEGGYDAPDIPGEISQAIIEWCAFKKGLAQLQGADQTTAWVQMGQFQQNVTVAGSAMKASAMDMPQSVAMVIANYERTVMG